MAVRIDDTDDVSNDEVTVNRGHSYWEKAVISLLKTLPRFEIDGDNAAESRYLRRLKFRVK